MAYDNGTEASALTLQIESIKDCWAEGRALVMAEGIEVEQHDREFNPDVAGLMVNEASGNFRILVARKYGRIVGYLSWTISFDLESYGTLIANQTAWYVKPGHYGIADKMFEWAVAEFRRIGVKLVYWHHTENGRGRTLGRYFTRKGAKLISHNYQMKL